MAPLLLPPSGADVQLWQRVLDRVGSHQLTDALVHATKASVAREFAAALDGAAIGLLIDELERDDPDECWSSGAARAEVIGVRERAAVGMLALAAAWESSGATAGALGVALHLSAAVAFGLGDESVERLRLDANETAFRRGEELHARHADGLRSYLQRQYDETQAFLDGADVRVYRGTTTAATAVGRVAVTLRPLSSFALERTVAIAFPMDRPVPPGERHALIAAAAPGARILSTPLTGMASLFEGEVVVLGAERPGDEVDLLVAPAGERVH